MPNTPNIHWTQDAELLEQYVMRRVDAERRKELEAHLLTCEECQRAVRDEQQLVLGIKRVGRDEMKARLKERLQTASAPPAQRTIPWVRITSIAATLVVLFGLGVYNKWIPLGTEESPVIVEKEIAAEPTQRQNQADDAASGQGAAQSKVEAPKPETLARRDAEQQREKAAEERAEQDMRVAEAPAPSAAGAAAKKYDAQAVELTDKAEGFALTVHQPMWVDGVVISSRQSTDESKDAARMDQRLRAVPQVEQNKSMQKSNTSAVTVTELPLDQLPPTQQMKQQRLDRNSVQTLIEQQNGNLNFTLYRQAPQQKLKQITQNAILEQAGPDSIVITIDGEQIGYKIRGGLDALQNQQTKTKK